MSDIHETRRQVDERIREVTNAGARRKIGFAIDDLSQELQELLDKALSGEVRIPSREVVVAMRLWLVEPMCPNGDGPTVEGTEHIGMTNVLLAKGDCYRPPLEIRLALEMGAMSMAHEEKENR